MDAGTNAAVLPAMSVASLVGFGAVVAAMPAFAVVRDAVLGIGGGPLVSLAVATNVLAALTGLPLRRLETRTVRTGLVADERWHRPGPPSFNRRFGSGY